jgi:GTP-binding protein Era
VTGASKAIGAKPIKDATTEVTTNDKDRVTANLTTNLTKKARGGPGKAGRKKHRAGFVAILGRPNAGKSTLLNSLLGTKLAIVASKPQTTRTSIQGVLTLPEAQIVFVDTPGIHKPTSLLNKHMMESVRAAAEAPDVCLFVIDAHAALPKNEAHTMVSEEDSHALDLAKKAGAPVIAVFNKIDWVEQKQKLFRLIEEYRKHYDFAAYVPISARRRDGLDVLIEEVVRHLPAGPAIYEDDYLTDQPERYLAAEVIREKILHQTTQEVPHSVAVVIDSWTEEPRYAPRPGKSNAPAQPALPMLRISATIFVERSGQKAIVIGAGGAALKKTGTQARQELERMLGRKVFLELLVKVRAGWREDPRFFTSIDWRGRGR